jgi:hypothetical protein
VDCALSASNILHFVNLANYEKKQATKRVDSFLEAGDMDGLAVWRRVLKAVKEI